MTWMLPRAYATPVAPPVADPIRGDQSPLSRTVGDVRPAASWAACLTIHLAAYLPVCYQNSRPPTAVAGLQWYHQPPRKGSVPVHKLPENNPGVLSPLPPHSAPGIHCTIVAWETSRTRH